MADIGDISLELVEFGREPLEQTYARLGHDRYRYSSNAGSFVTELTVNPIEFVTEYPGISVAE